MSADNDGKPEAAGRRFSMDDARQKAQQARQKAEHILARAWGLLRDPKAEWEQIRKEETTIPSILFGYVAPLAAIPPVSDFLGSALFNRMLQGEPGDAMIRAVTTWIVSVAMVFLLGLIINVVAESFDAERNELAAQKLAAYALTPAFLSGLFSLWPPLWWLSLFALAAMVFLMYRGLPILMKTPPERAVGYTAAITIAALVSFVVLFSLASCVTG